MDRSATYRTESVITLLKPVIDNVRCHENTGKQACIQLHGIFGC